MAFQTICHKHLVTNNLSHCDVYNAKAKHFTTCLALASLPDFAHRKCKYSFSNNLYQAQLSQQFVTSRYFQTICPSTAFQILFRRHSFFTSTKLCHSNNLPYAYYNNINIHFHCARRKPCISMV